MHTLFMFSGQGSHYFQMGSELFQRDPVFKRRIGELDEIAIDLLGISIVDLVYRENRTKSEIFDRTRHTSPAIFMVEMALAEALVARGVRPDAVLGVSLGIYAAACMAGCLPVEDALRAVIRQAEILEADCPPGIMLAVLDDPRLFENEPSLHENADLAGVNSVANFVISTSRQNLPRVTRLLDEKRITYQPLAVSQAFHSRWIDGARTRCLDLFRALPLRAPHIPLACSASGGFVPVLGAGELWGIMRQPIQLARTFRNLEAVGPFRYVDIGPSGTLATVLKYNAAVTTESTIHPILSPFAGEFDKFQRLVSAAVALAS